MITKKYTLHTLSIAVIFTLGNAMLSVQKINVINLFLSLVIILATNLLLKIAQKNKAIFLCVSLLVVLSAVYGVATAFIDYINFLRQEQMSQTGVFLLALFFASVVVIFSASKTEAIYKYCLFTVFIVAIITSICFVGGIRNFDFKNLNKNVFDFSFSANDFFRFCFPLMVLPFLSRDKAKVNFFGVIIAFLLLFLAAFQSCLTLGVATDVKYRYLKSVSVISSGSLFTRLDGLVWFLFFITCLIKSAVCIKAILKIIKGGK